MKTLAAHTVSTKSYLHELDVDELDDCGICAIETVQHDSIFNRARIVVNKQTNYKITMRLLINVCSKKHNVSPA